MPPHSGHHDTSPRPSRRAQEFNGRQNTRQKAKFWARLYSLLLRAVEDRECAHHDGISDDRPVLHVAARTFTSTQEDGKGRSFPPPLRPNKEG